MIHFRAVIYFMFRLNTIVTVFWIENIDLNDLNRYLFEIDWNINRQDNWLSIQYNIDNFLYFIDNDCLYVIKMHDFENFDKRFNDFFEYNLSQYRWQNKRRKNCFKTERFVCLLICFHQIYQFIDAVFTFLRAQGIQLSQSIIDVNHDNYSFVNKLKYHDVRIRKVKIVFANQLDSIKIWKSL